MMLKVFPRRRGEEDDPGDGSEVGEFDAGVAESEEEESEIDDGFEVKSASAR